MQSCQRPGDAQVARRAPDLGEAAAGQHGPRGGVVHQSVGLEAVQPEVIEGNADSDGDGGGGHASSLMGRSTQ